MDTPLCYPAHLMQSCHIVKPKRKKLMSWEIKHSWMQGRHKIHITAAVYIVLHISCKPLCRHPTKYPLVSGIFSCCCWMDRDRLVPLAATCCVGLPVSSCLDPSSRKQLKKKLAFVIPILDTERVSSTGLYMNPQEHAAASQMGTAPKQRGVHCPNCENIAGRRQPGPLLHHMHGTVSTLEQNKCYNPGETEGAQVHTQPSPAKLTWDYSHSLYLKNCL